MNYDQIYSLSRRVVLMNSKKIDFNKQMNTNELRYREKKYNEPRKV